MTNGYGPGFALLYDARFGGWVEAIAPHILTALAPFQANGNRILDLCCGTGVMALQLARSGWQVTAIDHSPGMLDRAKERFASLPDPDVIQVMEADMRCFSVPEPVNAAICIDGALNHLEKSVDLAKTFAAVAQCMQVGGIFVFDLLEASHLELWNQITVTDDDDVLMVRRGSWDPVGNVGLLTVSAALGKDLGLRVRHTMRSRTFRREKVEELLTQAGFLMTDIELQDPRQTGRSFYCAIKA